MTKVCDVAERLLAWAGGRSTGSRRILAQAIATTFLSAPEHPICRESLELACVAMDPAAPPPRPDTINRFLRMLEHRGALVACNPAPGPWRAGHWLVDPAWARVVLERQEEPIG